MTLKLYYWPQIQGRGEFVRLALEAAGAPYEDVARASGGTKAMMALMADKALAHPPFAPPFIVDEDGTLVFQTANILSHLGPRLGLEPAAEPDRAFVLGLALTIADVVKEAHDTHHPVASGLYYEEQKPEAKRYSASFRKERIPKFLGYFERVLEAAGGDWLCGGAMTYADLGLFQLVEGLRYAFPAAMKSAERLLPRVTALRDRVAAHPKAAAYLASERRIPFNEEGIFRRYPELDGD